MVCSKCGRNSYQYPDLVFYCNASIEFTETVILCEDCFKGRTPESKDVADEPKPENKSPIDVPQLIEDAMQRKDRTIHIFISDIGTSVYITPSEEEAKPVWKLVRGHNGKHAFLCTNCNRTSKQGYPYCPWCGEVLGHADSDVAEAEAVEREREKEKQK